MTRATLPPGERAAREKHGHEALMLAADLCGMDPTEAAALSEAYSLAATGKHSAAGRGTAFHAALATDHVFRGQVLKWWFFDKKQAQL